MLASTVSLSLTTARRATAASFAAYGFALGIWVVYIPAVRDRTGLGLGGIGVMLLLFGLSSFVAMGACGRVISRFGSRWTARQGAVAMGLTIVGPGLAHSQGSLALALVGFGLATGVQDAGQNAYAVELERAYGRQILSSMHGSFTAGSLVAAGIGAALITAAAPVPAVFAAAAAAVLASGLISSRYLIETTPERRAHGRHVPPWTKRVALLGSMSFALLMAEGVAFDWSSIHLRDVLHADRSLAAAGFGVFSLVTASVRLLADRVVTRVGTVTYLRLAALVAALGMALTAFAQTVPWAIAGWGVFGLGLAGCFAQVLSASGDIDRENSGANVARVAAIGYLGLTAGPSLIGFLAPHIGLRRAFVVPVLCMLFTAVLAGRVATQQPNGLSETHSAPHT